MNVQVFPDTAGKRNKTIHGLVRDGRCSNTIIMCNLNDMEYDQSKSALSS